MVDHAPGCVRKHIRVSHSDLTPTAHTAASGHVSSPEMPIPNDLGRGRGAEISSRSTPHKRVPQRQQPLL